MIMNLTPIQIDAFTELVNIGVGKAASSLNEIVDSHIMLSIPHVDILPLRDLNTVIAAFQELPLTSVSQEFTGDYAGSAALIFPSDSAVKLVSVLTDTEIDSAGLDAVRSGTLMEIGNIVINSILGTISNELRSSLSFMLPEYHHKDITSLVSKYQQSSEAGLIILAKADMIIQELAISGYIVFIFKINDLNDLIRSIDRFIAGGM